MSRATCGTALHHGAVWPLGLLVTAAALAPAAEPSELPALAGQLAAIPDDQAPHRPSPGSAASARYGAAGARGEARAGFPHVRKALTTLCAARHRGAREPQARLDALLTVMTTLQDTGLLHAAGPHGLRTVQSGAREIIEHSGTGTPGGREAVHVFDHRLRTLGLRPRGSAHLLGAALFLESLGEIGRPRA